MVAEPPAAVTVPVVPPLGSVSPPGPPLLELQAEQRTMSEPNVVDANEVDFLMTSPWISVPAILRRARAVGHVKLQWRQPDVSVSKSTSSDHRWLQQRMVTHVELPARSRIRAWLVRTAQLRSSIPARADLKPLGAFTDRGCSYVTARRASTCRARGVSCSEVPANGLHDGAVRLEVDSRATNGAFARQWFRPRRAPSATRIASVRGGRLSVAPALTLAQARGSTWQP